MHTNTGRELPGHLVALCGRAMAKDLNQRLATLGLSVGQWGALFSLSQNDGMTQTQLADALSVEQPSMASTLKRLEADGLIRRKPHLTDRRSSTIHLTARARKQLPSIVEQVHATNSHALKGLTRAEIGEFKRLLRVVISNASDPDPLLP